MNRRVGPFNRCVAAMLALAVTVSWAPATIAAGVTGTHLAEIRGSVLAADGLTALPGVSVKAANMQTREVYSSALTSESGVYSLRDLPAGEYDLAVQTSAGLYVADLLVNATAGKRTIVSLALRPATKPGQELQQGQLGPQDQPPEPPKGDEKKPDEGKKDEGKKDEGKKDEGKKDQQPPPEPQQQKKKKKGTSFWRSPGGAAIAIVAGAALVGIVANSAAGNDNNEVPPLTQSGASH